MCLSVSSVLDEVSVSLTRDAAAKEVPRLETANNNECQENEHDLPHAKQLRLRLHVLLHHHVDFVRQASGSPFLRMAILLVQNPIAIHIILFRELRAY